MKKLSIANIQKFIGLIFYCLSLFLTAFYIQSDHEPVKSISLFLTGWLGIPFGHFSWLANPLFIFALFVRKDNSLVLSVIAFVLSLSFICYSTIPDYSGDIYHDPIAGYGIGYFLWVLGLGLFMFGNLLTNLPTQKIVIYLIEVSFLALSFTLFFFHYFWGEGSQFHIDKERKRLFNEYCTSSNEIVNNTVNDTLGIFFDTAWPFDCKRSESGKWKCNHSTPMDSIANLKFSEERNYCPSDPAKDNCKPYRRKYSDNPIALPVDRLASEYVVKTKRFNIPEKYNILAGQITIKKSNSSKVIAQTKFTYDSIDNKFCGYHKNGRFSSLGFARRVFQLDKK